MRLNLHLNLGLDLLLHELPHTLHFCLHVVDGQLTVLDHALETDIFFLELRRMSLVFLGATDQVGHSLPESFNIVDEVSILVPPSKL